MKKIRYFILLLVVLTASAVHSQASINELVVKKLQQNLRASRIMVHDSITNKAGYIYKSSLGKTDLYVLPKPEGIDIFSSTGNYITLPLAIDGNSGLMTSADKIKLDSLASATPAPVVDATLEGVLTAGNVANKPLILADLYTDLTNFQGLKLGASSGATNLSNNYGTSINTSGLWLERNSTTLYSNDPINAGRSVQLDLSSNGNYAAFYRNIGAGLEYMNVSGADPTAPEHYTTKFYVDNLSSGLANKVDKVTGKSLISDAEIIRLAGISNVDISGKENISNKQNSLADDATNLKYPTVTAVNTGLATKANDNAVVHLAGTETITGVKTFSTLATFDASFYIKQGALASYVAFNGASNGLDFSNIGGTSFSGSLRSTFFSFGSASVKAVLLNSSLTATRNFTLPNQDGIFALTENPGTVSSGTTTAGNTPPTANNQLTRKDYVDSGLATKENIANKNVANGYAGLGSDGKLISSQLPSITISDTYVVASEVAMLGLTGAEKGDVAVRTDLNKSLILKGNSYSTLADWQELLTPTSSITTVFGRNGAITAQAGDYSTSLITEGSNLYYTDTRVSTNPSVVANTAKVTNATHTGDVAGSTELTLATVNNNVGVFGSNSTAVIPTVNGKGLITAVTSTPIQISESQVTNLATNLANKVDKVTGKSLISDTEITRLAGISNVDISGKVDKVAGKSLISDTEITRLAGVSNVDISGKANINGQVFTGAISATNLSNTNTGDNAANSLYSGLVSNATHTGDVTGSTTLTIANNVVSLAKLADVGTGTVFYRKTASTGDPEVQTLATLKTDLALSGTNSGDQTTISGNAGSATVLQTARSINGIPFNGGANITINAVDATARQPQLSGTGFIKASGTTISYDNSTYLTGISGAQVNSALGFTPYNATNPNGYTSNTGTVTSVSVATANGVSGTVGTATTTPAITLTLGNITPASINTAGTVTASGGFYNSDRRLKNILKRDGDVAYFKWKDRRDNKTHIGYVAQEVRRSNPDQVQKGEDKMLSVNYVEILVEKIRMLEKRIEELEKK